MESATGLGQIAMNLGAQALFVLFVWRMARRLTAGMSIAQEQDAAQGGVDGQGVASREGERLSGRHPEA